MGWTFYSSTGQKLSSANTSVEVLDIDGATDIGAAIVDADLFIIDDGAGGTNRKTAASRLKTYAATGQSDEAALVAETNEDTYAPPDLMKHHPGITKVWVMTNSDGDIEVPDYGCSSVGDSDTGNRRINFDTAFNGTKFGKQVTGDLAGGGERASGVSTSATDAMIYNSSNALADSETFFSAWGIF